jgi:hypothetical protein
VASYPGRARVSRPRGPSRKDRARGIWQSAPRGADRPSGRSIDFSGKHERSGRLPPGGYIGRARGRSPRRGGRSDPRSAGYTLPRHSRQDDPQRFRRTGENPPVGIGSPHPARRGRSGCPAPGNLGETRGCQAGNPGWSGARASDPASPAPGMLRDPASLDGVAPRPPTRDPPPGTQAASKRPTLGPGNDSRKPLEPRRFRERGKDLRGFRGGNPVRSRRFGDHIGPGGSGGDRRPRAGSPP